MKTPPIRIVLVATIAGLLLLPTGCRWEVSKIRPDPSPTPTPTPRPIPTPTPTPTPLTNGAVLSPAALRASFAEASADLIESATTAASESAESLSRSVQRVIDAPASAKTELTEAEQSLAATAASYRQAEAAVFYVNPESEWEVQAQPDPMGAGTDGGETDPIGKIATKLLQLRKVSEVGVSNENAAIAITSMAELVSLSKQLQADMESFAAAWKKGDPENFRTRGFLASSQYAVARVFQGMLAISGDVLPRKWLGADKIDPAQIGGRVKALEVLYFGNKSGAELQGTAPGVFDLVSEVSTAQAAAVKEALERCQVLSDALQIAPENVEVQRQLRAALEEVTLHLTLAGKSLGIEIVEIGN